MESLRLDTEEIYKKIYMYKNDIGRIVEGVFRILKMRIALLIFIFSYVLLYLGIIFITRNKNAVISEFYNDDSRDDDLYGVENASSLDKVLNQNIKNMQLIKDCIFWSDVAESFVPAGSSVKNSNKIVSYLRSQDVKSLTNGNHTHCGSRGNGFAVLGDGTRMCVRHRLTESKVQGDVLAFYLSHMLKMDNVPEIFLTKISNSTSLWRQLNISNLQWNETATVGMSKWIPDARQYQYFRFDQSKPGIVVVKIQHDGEEKELQILRTPTFRFQEVERPQSVSSAGLSDERRQYLRRSVSRYVRPASKDYFFGN